ncbi:MAG: glycosyltransferase [Chloroflexota bacterium]|nr:glycosyltransferase [Chloroflexota bacterium]
MSILVNARQQTILFLIADTGAGHRSAANAISNAIKIIAQEKQEASGQPSASKTPLLSKATSGQSQASVRGVQTVSSTIQASPAASGYRIEIVDVFEEYSRFPLREAVKLYGPTIRYNPKLFGEVFHRSNRAGTVNAVKSLATPMILNGLLRLITSVQPDVIVSIHPMLNHVTVNALEVLGLHIPFLTVVTDLVSVHYAWFAPGVDGYVVPTEQAKKLYLKRGLDPQRVHLLGMPIDPKFTFEVDSKEALQQKFGLKPGLPVILLVGGGDGAGGLHNAVRAISQARLPVQLMVVTGRNKRLYTSLQRTRAGLHVPLKVFGFVQNMPELMHASDVIITKAGPGTICEALACRLPIILSGYVPGQEEGNVDFVTRNEVGVLAMDSATLVDALRHLLMPGSPELRRFLEKGARLSHPMASFDIASFILSQLSSPEEARIWQTPNWQRRKRILSGRVRSAIRIRRLRRPSSKNLLSREILKNPVVRRISRLRIKRRHYDPTRHLE